MLHLYGKYVLQIDVWNNFKQISNGDNKTPRVAVVIYTSGDGCLPVAIESIVTQTYKDIGIIVCDDSSDDNTEIMREFMQQDVRIQYIKNEANLGLFENLIKAIQHCDAEYIAICSDEYIMLPHAIETQVQKLDEHPNAILCGATYFATNVTSSIKSSNITIFKKYDLINNDLECEKLLSPYSMMFRRLNMIDLELKFSASAGLAADWMLLLEINCMDYEIIGINHAIIKNWPNAQYPLNMLKIHDWCDTYTRIEEYLKSKEFHNSSKIRDYFIKTSLFPIIQRSAEEKEINVLKLKGDLKQITNEIKKRYGWEVSQSTWNSLAKSLLLDVVKKVGMKEVKFSDYERHRAAVREVFAYYPSKMVQLKWIKYFGLKILFFIGLKRLSQIYKNVISFPSYIAYLSQPVRHNSVLMVESFDVHAEILPGYSKYMLDLGYNVDVITTIENSKSKALCRLDDKRIRNYSFQPFFMKKLLLSKRVAMYEHLLVTSYFNDLMDVNDIKHPKGASALVIHEGEGIPDELHRKHNLLSLAEIQCSGVGNKTSVVNPHYFGEINVKNKKNDKTVFIAIGIILNARRNYSILMSAIDDLVKKGYDDFKIVVIGSGELSCEERLSRYFELPGKGKRVNFSTLYHEIEKADFILALMDTEDKRHDRYITTGTSGNFQLCYGFRKPILIQEKFAAKHRFNENNSIVYAKNADLSLAMQKAIDMDSDKYAILQNNLAKTSDELYRESLNNLRNVLL